VNEHILDNPMYDPMFSVETVNRLAADGMPFRDAYRQVGLDIEAGRFTPDKNLHHTHEGSIGNLCNDHIAALMDQVCSEFDFAQVDCSLEKLLNS
jgi:argininosuccinate lyase